MQELNEADWVKGGSGAYPGGMDSAQWESRWFDAVRLVQIENSHIDRERDKFLEALG
ncbi:MAG: hypothetical protein NVS1B6_00950 [Steroidobacteraceae bacterium]